MKQSLNESIKQAAEEIRGANKVVIVSHVNPDGDTIGCQLALGLALIMIGKKVTLLCQDPIPTRFQFLPGSELILSQSTEIADVAIAMDCGSAKQLGKIRPIFSRAKKTIQIDHHDFGIAFAKLLVLEEDASAVGEIVYELIRALKFKITPAIATCLLTSIIVDTGSFRFSNIRPKTFDICGKLIKEGVDLQQLIEASYWQKSRVTAKLSGHCMLNAQFSKDGSIAWVTVYQRDFKNFGAILSDVDPVADDLRSIEGVKIAAVFRETVGRRFRVSLRAAYGINVAVVAKIFGGGGHHNAAGCVIRNSQKERQRLLDELGALITQ